MDNIDFYPTKFERNRDYPVSVKIGYSVIYEYQEIADWASERRYPIQVEIWLTAKG
jgi:hypothetical protein